MTRKTGGRMGHPKIAPKKDEAEGAAGKVAILGQLKATWVQIPGKSGRQLDVKGFSNNLVAALGQLREIESVIIRHFAEQAAHGNVDARTMTIQPSPILQAKKEGLVDSSGKPLSQ